MIEQMSSAWESRSERRFVRKVDKYCTKRLELLEAESFSLSPQLGRLAIHVSTAPDERSKNSAARQKEIFQAEGEYLQEWYERQGVYGNVKLVPKTNRMALAMDIADKEVAGVVTIGHGSLGDFWLPDGGGHFDWQDVARNARHTLKRGDIIQRTCGNIYKKSVPWGTFAAADQTKIVAVSGQTIPEEHPPSELFRPVYTTPHNDREHILARVHAQLGIGGVDSQSRQQSETL